MELTFTKVGDKYVALFTVTSDFNIHIEKSGGRVGLFQSSIENGEYDSDVRQLPLSHDYPYA